MVLKREKCDGGGKKVARSNETRTPAAAPCQNLNVLESPARGRLCAVYPLLSAAYAVTFLENPAHARTTVPTPTPNCRAIAG